MKVSKKREQEDRVPRFFESYTLKARRCFWVMIAIGVIVFVIMWWAAITKPHSDPAIIWASVATLLVPFITAMLRLGYLSDTHELKARRNSLYG